MSGSNEWNSRLVVIVMELDAFAMWRWCRQQIVARSGNKTCGSQNHVFGKQVNGSASFHQRCWYNVCCRFCRC